MLNSQEKTIRYAQTQLEEGEFITAKCLLDTTRIQISK